MFDFMKKDWQKLKESDPGHRFQDRYYRHKEKRRRGTFVFRILTVSFGLVVIGVGIILLVTPGPGIVLLTVGMAIIAGESKILAQILDIGELIGRKLIGKQRTSA
ncbi:MAG: hypothetical protein GF372_11250 [Candidatus Marinimicrobia bacterium]|nr:hypothetical protein [Candidatus Neomarinimicrobiota bacterium]